MIFIISDSTLLNNLKIFYAKNGLRIFFTKRCYHIGTIEYKEKWYAFFQTADEEDEGDEAEVTILEVVEKDEEDELLPVEDEKLLDEVFEESCGVMEEDDDADEAASLDTDYEEGCGCGCKHHDHKHEDK